jgi:RNA-directed DNA polymerase
MKTPETVSIHKSKLFRLGRKKDLAALLGITVAQLKELAKDSNYREWPQKRKGKVRIIEEPEPFLASVLKRLHGVLKKVETPLWLMSGKKGVKSQDNALAHKARGFLINVDIESFYQSTKREFVYRSFQREFQIRDDVASLLSDLVTYKGHVPTGTATSQLVAFLAYRQTFSRIFDECARLNIKMTLWVDDITFSRDMPFPNNWVQSIDSLFRQVSLNLKTQKTKRYRKNEYKTVTGSAISASVILAVRNEKRLEVVKLLGSRTIEELSLKEARSLLGKLASQRQNEPKFFETSYNRCRAHIRKLKIASTGP